MPYYLIAGFTDGSSHIWHQGFEVLISQWFSPFLDDHMTTVHGLQDWSTYYHW